MAISVKSGIQLSCCAAVPDKSGNRHRPHQLLDRGLAREQTTQRLEDQRRPLPVLLEAELERFDRAGLDGLELERS